MKALVVTHAEGFLACFTREADGKIKQRALIDIGEHPPTAAELATMGLELADRFHWTNGARPIAPPRIRALEGAKRRNPIKRSGKPPRVRNARPEEIAERKERILAYVREHPNSSTNEVLTGVGIDPKDDRARGRWHWHFKQLREAGALREGSRNYKTTGTPIRWVVGK